MSFGSNDARLGIVAGMPGDFAVASPAAEP
jgi:hypothetical protein